MQHVTKTANSRGNASRTAKRDRNFFPRIVETVKAASISIPSCVKDTSAILEI